MLYIQSFIGSYPDNTFMWYFKNEPIWTKVILVYLFVFAETFILKFFFW